MTRKVKWGLGLAAVSAVLACVSGYIAMAAKWDVRAADMTTAIQFNAFVSSLPALIPCVICGFVAWVLLSIE